MIKFPIKLVEIESRSRTNYFEPWVEQVENLWRELQGLVVSLNLDLTLLDSLEMKKDLIKQRVAESQKFLAPPNPRWHKDVELLWYDNLKKAVETYQKTLLQIGHSLDNPKKTQGERDQEPRQILTR